MSGLTIYNSNGSGKAESYSDHSEIARILETIGARFERWTATRPLHDSAGQEEIIAAYRDSVDRLMRQYGFQSVDVINMTPDHPDRDALRNKFLQEHTHTDFEVRFFVDGKGLFCIHAGEKVYSVLCEKGDLISVPANTSHWFDMGEHPHFKCIRLFTRPEGWVADFTGSDIADRFPRLET